MARTGRLGRTGMALATGTALSLTLAAGAGHAANSPQQASGQSVCGATSADLRQPPAEPVPAAAPAAAAPSGAPAPPLAYAQPAQLPIGLWSAALVTLRAPAGHGTVRLDLTSKGFSTDSVEIQRYIPAAHRWLDLAVASGSAAFPTHGSFSFPVDTRSATPQTVALRLQDLDRPGSLTVAASYADDHGHRYRAPARTAAVTRPDATLTGWPAHPLALFRGGPAQEVTLTVRNTTDRAYPAVSVLFYAYGTGGGRVLTPRDLILEQYLAGGGWTRLPLVAGSCDPGLSAAPHPAAGLRLAPGATAVFRLRLGVAASAPRKVSMADAGLSVQSGDASLTSTRLPFTVRS
ncbi:hypothetical protein ABIA33_005702 [Streptacidiphilus sp. MAP12-16]|uniref:hypothetical protein n=1 Tax=Streptacidiphilus sp. MAP12-16 TaxID=3156300 RepID=UPI003513D134